MRDAAANPVFKALRDLGLDRESAICVERVDAALTDRTPGHGALRQETAPVWEMVEAVIVAVLAGLVGVVSLSWARANALIGVFISVTTIAAAALVGISIAYSSWHEAAGSVLQLLLNVVLLIAVGAAGLRAQRAIWRRRGLVPD